MRGRTEGRTEAGAVTAEAAIAISLLVLVSIGLAWLVCLGVVAVRAQDAAREAARSLARGDTPEAATGLALKVAVPESTVSTNDVDGLVHVRVRSLVKGPGGLFSFVGVVTISAEAVSLVEEK